MPRTKQPRKRTLSDSTSMRERDFDKLVELQLQKLQNAFECKRRSQKMLVDSTLSLYPEEILGMTLGDILSYDLAPEEEQNEVTSTNQDLEPLTPPTVKPQRKARKRMQTTSDDGYATERSTLTNGKARTHGKRSRSASKSRLGKGAAAKHRGSNNVLANTTTTGKENSDKNQTPDCHKSNNPYANCITPKIKPNCALNILRRPKHGEVALSMQGSPLLVSTDVQDRTANLNLPLNDGNVVSLLPSGSLRMSSIPTLDPKTMEQLRTLKAHIEKVVNVNEKRRDSE